ncbi:MAG: hypothetical protein BGO55_14270 [Sphingobacteriales bacterium 50-39]|nr:hypothetical protein [Sphingobacteriales bacterium]OJW57454.1 MAG: hypothetical protein BGO55_14270 [Sphingobacteriales bacterium 50-39]
MNNEYKRPIDRLPDDPFTAMEESWELMPPSFVMPEIVYWSLMAMSHQSSLYAELKYRTRFIAFFADLLLFLEATYVYARKMESEESPGYLIQYLSKDHKDDPIKAIKRFCNNYPHSYVTVELWFFYQGVQFYEGPLTGEYETSEVHLHLLTLVESFYQILEAK